MVKAEKSSRSSEASSIAVIGEGSGEGDGGSNLPSASASTSASGREIDSVRELNRLLESALRLGESAGGGGGGASGSGDVDYRRGGGRGGGAGGSSALSGSTAAGDVRGGDGSASWRLDTARRLSSLLSSQKTQAFAAEDGGSTDSKSAYVSEKSALLLPALRRQSRYWIPLLLSWLRQDGGGDSDGDASTSVPFDPTAASLPPAPPRSRSPSQSVGGGGIGGGGSGRGRKGKDRRGGGGTDPPSPPARPEVQIEALRALTALTEWTARAPSLTSAEGADADSSCGTSGSGEAENTHSSRRGKAQRQNSVALSPSSSSSLSSAGVTEGCDPQTPLSPASQRLLLRHADAVPMIVSLLASPDAAVHEQAVWILGSIAAGGLGASPPPPQSAGASTPSSRHSQTPALSSSADVGTSGDDGGSDSAIAQTSSSWTGDGGNGKSVAETLLGSLASASPSPVGGSTRLGGGGTPSESGEGSSSAASLLDEHLRGDTRCGGGGSSGGRDGKSSSSSPPPSVSARDVILAAGAVGPLLRCLDGNPRNVALHRVGAWCLSSLVEGRYSGSSTSQSGGSGGGSGGSAVDGSGGGGSGGGSSLSSSRKYSTSDEIDVRSLLPTLKRMLHLADAEALSFTCWTLSHLCDGPAAHIAAVISSVDPSSSSFSPHPAMSTVSTRKKSLRSFLPDGGLVPRLVELLLHPCPKVAKPALRTIGNIVCAECGDHQNLDGGFPIVDYTEVILECNAVPCLRHLVGHANREIQKEACWTLSNIAAGTTSQIQAVISSGAIPPLVELVNNELTDKEVRSEACWVVLNATSCGSDEQIEILVEEGCVSVLGVLLNEPSMVMMALEGLERVLQTEEAKDAAQLRARSALAKGGGGVDTQLQPVQAQRQTTLKCASLIKGVVESPQNSGAVSKRARRIWDTHFVSCALCHGSFSRHRTNDARFCNECKCHVCLSCDCRVYHLSYQEELWAEDEDKAEAKKNAKKSKKQKKKEKEKQKKEKKKQENQAQQQKVTGGGKNGGEGQTKGLLATETNTGAAAGTPVKNESATNSSSDSGDVGEKGSDGGPSSSVPPNELSVNHDVFRRTNPRLPKSLKCDAEKVGPAGNNPSDTVRGGSDDDDTASLGVDGDDILEESECNRGQPPIDLVLYLQQTGSIIALAKLMDSLYEDGDGDGDGYEDEDEDAEAAEQRQTIKMNQQVLTSRQ